MTVVLLRSYLPVTTALTAVSWIIFFCYSREGGRGDYSIKGMSVMKVWFRSDRDGDIFTTSSSSFIFARSFFVLQRVVRLAIVVVIIVFLVSQDICFDCLLSQTLDDFFKHVFPLVVRVFLLVVRVFPLLIEGVMSLLLQWSIRFIDWSLSTQYPSVFFIIIFNSILILVVIVVHVLNRLLAFQETPLIAISDCCIDIFLYFQEAIPLFDTSINSRLLLLDLAHLEVVV